MGYTVELIGGVMGGHRSVRNDRRAPLGVQAKSLGVGAALFGGLHRSAGDGSQSHHFLTRAWSECNALGTRRRLPRRQGGIRLGLGQENPVLLFHPIAKACQYPHDRFDDWVEEGLEMAR